VGGERPCRQATHKCDELAPLHSRFIRAPAAQERPSYCRHLST
jgi:hypothetical protein